MVRIFLEEESEITFLGFRVEFVVGDKVNFLRETVFEFLYPFYLFLG